MLLQVQDNTESRWLSRLLAIDIRRTVNGDVNDEIGIFSTQWPALGGEEPGAEPAGAGLE
jgi:hypothetical protein